VSETTIINEMSLACCALMEDDVAVEAVSEVTPDAFYHPGIAGVWEAIGDLVAESIPVDFQSVLNVLASRGKADIPFLSDILGAVPTAVNWRAYAKVVRTHHLERRTRDALRAALEAMDKPGGSNVTSVIENASGALLDLLEDSAVAAPVSMDAVMPDVRRELHRRAEHRGVTGIRTGFDTLDSYTGGLQPGRVYLIGARPSRGKSAIGGNIAMHAAMTGRVPALVVTLEMDKAEYGIRLVAEASGHDVFEGVRPEAAADVTAAMGRIGAMPCWIHDATSGMTLAALRAIVRSHKRRYGTELVVLDYVQLMGGDPRLRRLDVLGQISRGLKALAKAERVAIIALAQLRRLPDGVDRAPTMSDVRECGDFEQDADGIILLHPQGKDEALNMNDRWAVAAIVAKMRGGRTGVIPLAFDRPTTTFRETTWERFKQLVPQT
jgi:replicative DNA helicase